jgi:hypothetical protein
LLVPGRVVGRLPVLSDLIRRLVTARRLLRARRWSFLRGCSWLLYIFTG